MPTTNRDYRDIVGGAILIVIGLFFAWYASSHYALGALNRMGPGTFPTVLGILQAGLGALLMVQAFFRRGIAFPRLELRTFFTILGAAAIFALFINTLGMVPTVALMTIVAATADSKLGVIGALVLAAALSALAALTFKVGLGIHVHLFGWPFQ